jgi:hypothetical protein
LGYTIGTGDIDRFRMTAGVVGVVGERAEREGELVDVARVAQQRFDEVARADVVHEVAEELVAERVVAQILNHRSAVRERRVPEADRQPMHEGSACLSNGSSTLSHVTSIVAS